MQYLGHLAGSDPLQHYLQAQILPQLGCCEASPEFRVFRLGGQHSICLYEERHSGLRVVGKFFARPYQPGTASTQRQMDREYENLLLLSGYGLAGYPHKVVRPLGRNACLSSVLIEEHVADPRLSQFFDGASRRGERDKLFAKLTGLAYFLATLHNRTANGLGVDFGADCRYLDRLVGQLLQQQAIGSAEAQELFWLRDRWAEQPRMWEDQQVLVHGDATPANFLMGDGLQVTAIDLERMKRADRVFDVGRIAGELQHAFLQATGDKYAAEPFIGHFLWEYACHFPDRQSAFTSICRRVPFQMALTLLRIARNDWVSQGHRRRLIDEARTTLRTF
jgi:aminoglycoside phosphotransferase (APT) family kinase protein